MISARGQRQDTSRNHILIKRGDPLHRVLNIRWVRPDITRSAQFIASNGRTPLTPCSARIIVEASRNWRGPWRGPGRFVVPLSQGTPMMPTINIRPARVSARQMRQPHKCRNARKAWQVHPRHRLEKNDRSCSLLKSLARGHCTVALFFYPLDCGQDRLVSHGHMIRIRRAKASRCPQPKRHVLSKQQISPPKRRILGKRLAKRGLLHVAVPATSNPAGRAPRLHQTRTIYPEGRVPTPEVRRPEQPLRHSHRVVLWLHAAQVHQRTNPSGTFAKLSCSRKTRKRLPMLKLARSTLFISACV